MNRWSLIKWAIIVEGSLAAVFVVWNFFRPLPTPSFDIQSQVVVGIAAIVPLLLINVLLFGPWAESTNWLQSCVSFRNTIVKPLADQLDLSSALVISLAAGIGEELFFRGVLQNEFGWIFASLLFALLHFGTACLRFRIVATVYLLVGLYLGWLYIYSGSLLTVIITHALYDWIALVVLRRLEVPEMEPGNLG
jgi:hypothetical protein